MIRKTTAGVAEGQVFRIEAGLVNSEFGMRNVELKKDKGLILYIKR